MRNEKGQFIKGSQAWRLRKKSYIGKNNPAWLHGKPKCKDCNMELSSYSGKVCNTCKGKNMLGEKHWNWQGGITQNYNKRWDIKNKDKRNFYTKRRLRFKKSSGGSHTFEEWENIKKLYKYMCLCCKRQEPEIKLTEDHIIPLIKGGTDFIWNIQPLCKSCNSQKHIKILDYRKEVFLN